MSETMHTPDKSKLPKALQVLEWQAMEPETIYEDGTQLLIAVPVCEHSENPTGKWYYEINLISIHCDEDYFDVECSTCQCSPGWELDAADFYVQL